MPSDLSMRKSLKYTTNEIFNADYRDFLASKYSEFQIPNCMISTPRNPSTPTQHPLGASCAVETSQLHASVRAAATTALAYPAWANAQGLQRSRHRNWLKQTAQSLRNHGSCCRREEPWKSFHGQDPRQTNEHHEVDSFLVFSHFEIPYFDQKFQDFSGTLPLFAQRTLLKSCPAARCSGSLVFSVSPEPWVSSQRHKYQKGKQIENK